MALKETWAPLCKTHNRHHHPNEPCPYCRIEELEKEVKELTQTSIRYNMRPNYLLRIKNE